MTTKHSSLRRLKAQADEIAATLKAIERGEVKAKDGARERPSITFGVGMDDKVLKVEMSWDTIRATSEAGISEYLLKHMREQRATVQ